MNKITVGMPYIGKVLSVNHYKYLGKYTRREVIDWMEELGWKLKPYHIEDWGIPLKVTCDGVFRDNRSTPDLSNLSKVVLDAIEDVTDVNDKNMRWRDGKVTINKNSEPTLWITVRQTKRISKGAT